jgi:hypothetical protein
VIIGRVCFDSPVETDARRIQIVRAYLEAEPATTQFFSHCPSHVATAEGVNDYVVFFSQESDEEFGQCSRESSWVGLVSGVGTSSDVLRVAFVVTPVDQI